MNNIIKAIDNCIDKAMINELHEEKILINNRFVGVKTIEIFNEYYLYIGYVGADTGKVFNLKDYVYEFYNEFINNLVSVLNIEKPF